MKPRIINILYVGKRYNGKRLIQLFMYGKTEIRFTGITRAYIGHYYQCEKTKDGFQMKPKEGPSDKESIPYDQIEKYEIEESAAVSQSQRDKAYTKANSQLKYIKKLMPLFENISFVEVSYFCDQLAQIIIREKLKRK